ncbi:transcription factor cwo isoform X3 [Folsomia candida]|uniref:transcription factor cwo isoform X3 n=1 Tax=Folsomia candida TaxID=158441 RepID=UPI0016052FA3|nr:transcription factor cwo isoform X3 [Folsomia candida]
MPTASGYLRILLLRHGTTYTMNLNFATGGAVEENEYGFPKKKTVRDPLSHRIIEKRRRDRMNNCLADLARLLPPSSLRKGRGRIEKTEIVELAIKHLRHLQTHLCPSGDKCEFNYIVKGSRSEGFTRPPLFPVTSSGGGGGPTATFPSTPEEHFRLGFHECMSETMHFLVEDEGMYPGDSLCVRILKHLGAHSENLMREHFGKEGKLRFLTEIKKEETDESPSANKQKLCDSDCNNGNSSSSGYAANGSSISSGSEGNRGQDAESPESFPPVQTGPGGNIGSGGCGGSTITTTTTTTDGGSYFLPPSERTAAINIDYEGENSCCSTQLSLDISDVLSVESKSTTRKNGASGSPASNKPPIPTAISCTSSPMTSSSTAQSNWRSADEGHETGSASRYKFKNNIKQRFVADHLVPGRTANNSGGEEDVEAVMTRSENKLSNKHKDDDEEHQSNTGARTDFLDDEEEGRMKVGRNNSSSSPTPPGGEEEGEEELMLEEDCGSNKSYERRRRRRTSTSDSCSSSNRTISIENMNGVVASDLTSKVVMATSTTTSQGNSPPPDSAEQHDANGGKRLSGESAAPVAVNVIKVENPARSAAPSSSSAPLNPIPTAEPGLLGESENCGGRVPAFALHEKGLYYIPLMIDKAMLSPYLDHAPIPPPPLHPVTINVCFLLSSPSSQPDKVVGKPAPQFLKNSLTTSPPTSVPMTSPPPGAGFVHIPPPQTIIPHPLLVTPASQKGASLVKCVPMSVNKPSPKEQTNFSSRYSSSQQQQQQQHQSSRQQGSPVPYRYPITGPIQQISSSSSLPSSHIMSHHPQKDVFSGQYYPVGYYAESSHPGHIVPHQQPPSSTSSSSQLVQHGGGYSSSSNSSSSSNHGRQTNNTGRKRSIANISPISSSSSLGYHSSFHDNKYSPDPFPTAYNHNLHHYNASPSSTSGAHHSQQSSIHHGVSISSSNRQQHHALMGLHPHILSTGGYGGTLATNHLIMPGGGSNCIDLERRRSCSPNKRVKRSRGDVDDILKMKQPHPIIPLLPAHDN